MYSKFQTIEKKMDEQDVYRNNVRDHFNGKTPPRMFKNESSHQQYGNRCQQPSQNWQVPQQHQLQKQYQYEQQQQQHMQQRQHMQQQQHMQQRQHMQQQQHMRQQQYYRIPKHQQEGQYWQQCNNYPVPRPHTGFYMNKEQQPLGTGQNQHQEDGESDMCLNGINFQNMPMPYSPNHTSGRSHAHAPLPRNPQLHLPSIPRKIELESDEAGGDRILYRNEAFKNESSITFEIPEGRNTERLHEYSKEALPYLESARAQCAAADAQFKAKFDEMDAIRSEDESEDDSKRSQRSTPTVISGKSGEDLRSVVRSQIALQQALDQSVCNVTDINDEIMYKAKDLQRECEATISSEEGLPTEFLEGLTSRTQAILTARRSERGSQAGHLSQRDSRLSNNQPRASSFVESEMVVSYDEVVATRIVSPIMRQVQRMYTNSLREEMALIENLERLPLLISDVYKTAVQQERNRNS